MVEKRESNKRKPRHRKVVSRAVMSREAREILTSLTFVIWQTIIPIMEILGRQVRR
ncbi:hypothetical protein ES703_70732 [subsurface metagenome]